MPPALPSWCRRARAGRTIATLRSPGSSSRPAPSTGDGLALLRGVKSAERPRPRHSQHLELLDADLQRLSAVVKTLDAKVKNLDASQQRLAEAIRRRDKEVVAALYALANEADNSR